VISLSNIIYPNFNRPQLPDHVAKAAGFNIYLNHLLYSYTGFAGDIDGLIQEALGKDYSAERFQATKEVIETLSTEATISIEMTVEAQTTTLDFPISVLSELDGIVTGLQAILTPSQTIEETTVAVIRAVRWALNSRGYNFPIFVKRMIVKKLLESLS
jgi:hypothetical protein